MTTRGAYVTFRGSTSSKVKVRKCRKSTWNTCSSLWEVGKAYMTVKVKGKVQSQTHKNTKKTQSEAGAYVGWVGGPKKVGGWV